MIKVSKLSELQRRADKLAASHGEANPFVKQLRQQIADMSSTKMSETVFFGKGMSPRTLAPRPNHTPQAMIVAGPSSHFSAGTRFFNWEARPGIIASDGRGWLLPTGASVWERANSSEIIDSGDRISAEVFDEMFEDLLEAAGPLPAGSF